MAQLAIRGESYKVIELLKMLGGYNGQHGYTGCATFNYYYIKQGIIKCIPKEHIDDSFSCFILEHFLEKVPYKVGDKVIYTPLMFPYSIKEIRWNAKWNSLYYTITNNDGMDISSVSAENLQPYKEETMEGKLR